MIKLFETLNAKPAATRVTASLIAAALGLFNLGLAAGVAAAWIVRGSVSTKLWVVAIPLVAIPLGLMLLVGAWRLAQPPRESSEFEKRYWKMWLGVVLCGIPLGAMVAAAALSGRKPDFLAVISMSPIDGGAAIAIALVGSILLVAAMLMYHRAIDPHEEHAYLWGSQVAYYFVGLVFPVWWILERGGLVPAMTVGKAMIVILSSFIVQAAVWAWLKFR